MKVKMELLSDVIFGNGISVPGGEDISILCDTYGFPYYKGGTFKGIFREELIRYLNWSMDSQRQVNRQETVDNKEIVNAQEAINRKVERLLGKSGDSEIEDPHKIVFSDFHLSDYVRRKMLEEIGTENNEMITDALSHIRTFTRIAEDGMVQEGSLRRCRCVNKGLVFYSELYCDKEDEKLICETLRMIKWIGSMRNRGFGKVRITEVK